MPDRSYGGILTGRPVWVGRDRLTRPEAGKLEASGTTAQGRGTSADREREYHVQPVAGLDSVRWFPFSQRFGQKVVPSASMDIFDDLTAEQDRVEAILDAYDTNVWMSPSGCPGWTVTDVVLHLAQSEEWVIASVAGHLPAFAASSGSSVDDFVDAIVRAERADPNVVFDRWRTARRAAVKALREVDPQHRLPWVTNRITPRALATTRLAEHWAHGLDITDPFDVPFPDTDRLRHIAWLGHRSLPYAFSLAGQESHEVFCELTGPSGATWCYGPPDAASTISGSAGAFCRVGAQRLAPEASGLTTAGPHGATALRILRNYAS